jgi:hypothetical protein
VLRVWSEVVRRARSRTARQCRARSQPDQNRALRPHGSATLSSHEAVTAESARREPIDSLAWLMVASCFPSRYEAAMRAAQSNQRSYQPIRPYYFCLGRSANVWARCDRLELFPAPLPAVSVHDLAIEVRRLSYRTVTLASKHNAIAPVRSAYARSNLW